MPRFHVWTLGCQMNRSDSEEMAGALLAAGCAEAGAWRRPISSSSTLRDPRGGRAEGDRPDGSPGPAREANPGAACGHDGCSVRANNGRRAQEAIPAGRPVPATRRGARADHAPGPGRPTAPDCSRRRRATQRVGASFAATADGCPAPAPRPWGRAASPRQHVTPGCRSSTAATRPAPTASCRSRAGPSGAGRSTTSSPRRVRWPRPAIAR